MSKPKGFIGSSSQGLEFARAVQAELSADAALSVWNQGVIRPGYSTHDEILRISQEVDFAILVFTPDDKLRSRGQQFDTAAQNVLVEYSIFGAKLGKERVFALRPKGVKIPSDFDGVTLLEFDFSRKEAERRAVAPACFEIRKAIKCLPSREIGKESEFKLGALPDHQRQLREKVVQLGLGPVNTKS